MRYPRPARLLPGLSCLAALFAPATAQRLLESSSLRSCQKDSGVSMSYFNVAVTPDNNTVTIKIVGDVAISGRVIFDVALNVYGHEFLRERMDPCNGDLELPGVCPMTPGPIDLPFNFPIDGALDQVPNIAYGIPDLDATVRAFVNMSDSGESVACVEADFSTGKTVDLPGVQWATAVIIGLGLIASAVVSLLGYANTAAHLAANTLSLLAYFQAQAIVGLTGIHMPPIALAWTQNFQWSMGIIRVGWMQDIFTWYQRATGGTPASLFNSLATTSVQVAKRSLDHAPQLVAGVAARGVSAMFKRANIELESGSYIVYGIQRVAFRAEIETTNLFLTGFVFFCIFVVLTVLLVTLFKGICDLCVRQSWIKRDRFLEFRTCWRTYLKGILLRLTLIGFPQMTILCLWEFTQVDSPAIVVLAVLCFLVMLLTLGSAAFRVVCITRGTTNYNPAFTLYSNSEVLNKWGFLYVQFSASSYYFIIPLLAYILIKGMFISLGQHNGLVQAVALIVIEAAALVASSVLRPWMDKSTSSFNIAICVVNFLNAIYLLIFVNEFDMPLMGPSIVGLILFVTNAAFSLILLIMLIVSTALIFWRKNPDARYQFMADDRASFMKSQTNVDTHTELDALAATARGDKSAFDSRSSLQDEDRREPSQMSGTLANPALPLFPSEGHARTNDAPQPVSPYSGSHTDLSSRHGIQGNTSPSVDGIENQSSLWHRGAGYDR
ncbi:hypothetical protein FZEAL_339 [Fusarium zealandicum]|uniref:ML-like domain-containing protein n=1 Tax=Fusarium zealandicum TaxID=1053134 RepID=A0A8H4XPX8_9HYPO|nr:hypothetical protein FZEAL_339 [Fusarium zealandicum]